MKRNQFYDGEKSYKYLKMKSKIILNNKIFLSQSGAALGVKFSNRENCAFRLVKGNLPTFSIVQ